MQVERPAIKSQSAAGSPKAAGRPPPHYPHQERKPLLPATRPPNRKPEALKRFLDEMNRSDEIVREMMRPDVGDLNAWLAKANF